MINMFSGDLNRCIEVLEDYIIREENELIENDGGGGEREWKDLNDYHHTLSNLKFMRAIYGE